ncbi:hypothetical protein [Pedobacter immunditicola]|uniref:hypothetical protein n=1 Tax=Pedobacter immunditicola TaxID=3133440 RepID=UPI00309BD381
MDSQRFELYKWIKWALFNLLVVAIVGIILRYKINFSFPLVDQKFLLHGHSHFAFTGWITLALMALMVNYLNNNTIGVNFKKYDKMLIATNLVAYGMLFTFIYQGYAFLSITFSTLSILVSYVFIYFYWRDLNKIKQERSITIWFKAALVLWFLSSLGVFTLAYLMATDTRVQEWYFASIYFFLHFQYNGWFLFASFGLFFSLFMKDNSALSLKTNKMLFIILVVTVIPTYLLSVLWLNLPAYLHWTGVIFGIVQLAAIYYMVSVLRMAKQHLSVQLSQQTKWLWMLVWLAFVLKIGLQTLSIFPYLGEFAFSFRPIVIGYLHLCFLCILSFFIIGLFNYLLEKQGKRLSLLGVSLFVSGVLLQEFVLMIQGLTAFQIYLLPAAGIILFAIALLIGSSLVIINLQIRKDT